MPGLPFAAAQLLMGYYSSIPPPAPSSCRPFFVSGCPPAPQGTSLPSRPSPASQGGTRLLLPALGTGVAAARFGISRSRRTAIWLQKEGIRKASASSPAADVSGCLWPTPSLPRRFLRRGEVIDPARPSEGAGDRRGLRARTLKSASRGQPGRLPGTTAAPSPSPATSSLPPEPPSLWLQPGSRPSWQRDPRGARPCPGPSRTRSRPAGAGPASPQRGLPVTMAMSFPAALVSGLWWGRGAVPVWAARGMCEHPWGPCQPRGEGARRVNRHLCPRCSHLTHVPARCFPPTRSRVPVLALLQRAVTVPQGAGFLCRGCKTCRQHAANCLVTLLGVKSPSEAVAGKCTWVCHARSLPSFPWYEAPFCKHSLLLLI